MVLFLSVEFVEQAHKIKNQNQMLVQFEVNNDTAQEWLKRPDFKHLTQSPKFDSDKINEFMCKAVLHTIAKNENLKSRFDKLTSHLRLNLPQSKIVTILHNDFKLDNIMWSNIDPFDPVAVFDWDMCTRGDPLMDVGHMLNYWIDENDNEECKFITSMPTDNILYPTRKEIIDYYSNRTGFDLENINWYYAFGAFKLAVILQQIYIRYLKGQTKDKRFSTFGNRVEALINRANNVFHF